ncbi:MAG: alpha/beta fold hydrolase [Nocardioides sp.]|uniref:alpha/beta fold hydrolase n=1 Tax=Nocardioides sp. TaxID=35761 RepID=UPI0039E5E06C
MTRTWDDAAPLHRGGHGEPLVLLHGVTSTWHAYKPVIEALEQDFDVIAPTLPGHLGWPWPDGSSHGIAAMGDLIADRLAELGVERPHLVGNSLGGWIALDLAARGKARSVTALSPAGGWSFPLDVGPVFLPAQAKIAEMRPQAAEILADPERRQRLMLPYLEHGERVPPADAVLGWDGVLAVDTLPEMLAAFPEPVLAPVPESVPVSIAWGTAERLLPESLGAPGWLAAAPAAITSRIEGAGHMPMYDAPDAVVELIRSTAARA